MSGSSWEDAALRPPAPEPDDLTRFFWEGVAQHKLLIQRCSSCGQYSHPPLPYCRFCLTDDLVPTEVSGCAVLDTFTVIMQPLHPYFVAKVPYNLSVVELEEQRGLKLVTSVLDCSLDDLRVGVALAVSCREVVPGIVLPYFVSA